MHADVKKMREIIDNLDLKEFKRCVGENTNIFKGLKDAEDENPLHWISQVRNFEGNLGKLEAFKYISNILINLLKDDVNAISKSGETPLLMLCEPSYGNLNADFAEQLIIAGANVNVKNERLGCITPLHYVAIAGYPAEPLQKVLLENGADYTARNNDGLTPFNYS